MTVPGIRKLFCLRGHGLIDGNIYISNTKRGPIRRCKTCKKDWERERYKIKKAGKLSKSS